MAHARAEFQHLLGRINNGVVASGDAFGTRDSRQEQCPLPHRRRCERHSSLHLALQERPVAPAAFFWSLTPDDQPASLLVANPIHPYLLNSTMLSPFTSDDDGGLMLDGQNQSPGQDRQANRQPSPKRPLWLVLPLYALKPEALDAMWIAPPVKRWPHPDR